MRTANRTSYDHHSASEAPHPRRIPRPGRHAPGRAAQAGGQSPEEAEAEVGEVTPGAPCFNCGQTARVKEVGV